MMKESRSLRVRSGIRTSAIAVACVVIAVLVTIGIEGRTEHFEFSFRGSSSLWIAQP